MNAADELHDDVAAVIEDVDRRGAEERRIDAGTRFVRVPHQNPAHGDVDSVAPANALAFAREQIDESAADGAASEQSDVYPAHAVLLGAIASSAWSRSSMRSRTSSSPTESRINPSAMPTFRRTSGSTEACVIVGGWQKRLFTPPRLSASVHNLRRFVKSIVSPTEASIS